MTSVEHCGKAYRGFAIQGAAEVEKGRFWFASCFCILLLTIAIMQSNGKPLWYDELTTFYVSHLSTLGMIWGALKDGADLNPPLLYVATRASHVIFGDGAVATRLPETLGFLVMSVCLFLFVSRSTNAVFGLVAMLFPWVSGAERFAYEARPYGLLLGFCGLALVFWQAACRQRTRTAALVGLTLSLSGALLSHCYAVLLVVPFAAAELVRFYRRERSDWPLWISIAITAPLVLTYIPLLHTTGSYRFDNDYFRPTISSIPKFWSFLLAPALLPLLLSFVVATAGATIRREHQSDRIPAHEIGIAVGLMCSPLAAWAIGLALTRVYLDRYCLPAIIGCSIVFAYIVFSRSAERAFSGVSVIIILILGVIANGCSVATENITRSKITLTLQPEDVQKDLPFVVANGPLFLQLDHDSKADVASRMYFLRDAEASLEYTGSNGFDKAYDVYRRWYPIRGHIEDYDKFMCEHQRFLVYGPLYYALDWLIFKLVDERAEMNFKGQFGDSLLFEVRRAGNHCSAQMK